MDFISIISSIFIWCAAAVILLRLINISGINFNDSAFFKYVIKDNSFKNSFSPTGRETAAVFGISFLFRLAVFIISVFAIFIANDKDFSFNELLNSYLQWDANNYYRIAKGGYSYHIENGAYTTLAFFPLYPWLIRIVNLFFNNIVLSGLVLSCLLYSGACAYMYRLLACDYNKSAAIRAIVYVSVFPHSFFFGTMMNESMLFFTMTATFYYIRTHNWVKTGIFGAFAALSRMAGILLAVPAAVEWLEYYEIFKKIKSRQFKEVWRLFYKKGLWIFLMLGGTLVYLFCNFKTTGEWFKFLEYQKDIWHNGAVYFGDGISTMFNYCINETRYTRFAIWLPEVISVVFVTATLIYGIRKARTMYTSFLIVYIIINTGFAWPISVARYMCCAIPSFIILADFAERHKWTEHIISAVMAVAMGVFLTCYFMSRQIL